MSNRLTELEKFLFDKLIEKRKIQALNMTDHSMSGLIRGSSDIYPDPAHFVYELLQNADDAKATKASFHLYKEFLIFVHNGKRQFTITEDGELGQKVKPDPYGDINSITAYSSSKENEPNTIGKFGLGFKSVYTYTDRPEIYDDKFWFAIEDRMVPVLLEHDHELRKRGETLFVLPFKTGTPIKEISDKLMSLQAPTLFLQSLDTVCFSDEISGKSLHFVKDVIETKKSGDINYQLVVVKDGGVKSQLLLFHRFVNSDGMKLKVSIGYFFNKEGEINTSTSRGIHCFFPTSETSGLCFISHAPFLLTNNRQNITRDNFNKKLLRAIGNLAADALTIIKKYNKDGKHLLKDNLYDFLPYSDYYRYQSMYDFEFQAEKACKMFFLQAIKELLEKQALLYTTTKGYVTICNACFFSTAKLQNIIKTAQLRELLQDDKLGILKIEENSDLRSFLSDYLGINQFEPENLAKRITPTFMQNQGTDWAKRLYKYLKEDAVRLWDQRYRQNAVFRYSPIFLTQRNEWVAPFKMIAYEEQPNIYLPIGDAKGTYNFVHQSLIDEDDEDLKGFYKKLGINKPDIIDFLQKHIIPKYQDEKKINELRHEDILADFNTVFEIYKDEKDDHRKDEILKIVKDRMLFLAHDKSFYRTWRLYIRSIELSQYFRGNNDVEFLDLEFYTQGKKSETKDDITAFFINLGVEKTPRLTDDYPSRYSFNENRYNKVDFKYSTQGYDVMDYCIDGFNHFINNNLNLSSSKYLWSVLSHEKDLEKYREGEYCYFYYSEKYIAFESSLFDGLKNKKWLVNSKNSPCSAKDITQEEMMNLGYENNEQLFRILGIRKREKSLSDLGATEEQQRQQEWGALAEDYGVSTKEELEEILKEYKKSEELKQRARNVLNHRGDTIDSSNSGTSSFDTYGSSSGKESSILSDLYGDSKSRNTESSFNNKSTDSSSNQKRIEDILKRLDDDKEKKLKRETLKQEVEEIPKYTKEWFQKKLQLEYWDTCDSDSNSSTKRSISISFSRIVIDHNNNRLYELRNPSRDIPVWVEEVENLTVKFLFNDRDEMPCSFEVANVRDFSLRLKAKASDAESMSSIDWTKLTQATIDINNPTNLVDNFRRAFNELIFPDGYNLKENLRNNISFVFGPPGTGKTTFVAKHIIDYVHSKRTYARILVLAPTNKACDVLVKKIMEADDSYSWLGRFVTTGDPEIEDNGLVCDRNSELFQENKCCIVTTMARLPYDGFQTEDGYHYLRDIDWNLVICDEASMLPIAQIIYAIYKFKDVPFLIAGDPMQIAPIDVTDNWNSENIYDMVNLKSFESPTTEPIQFKITNLETQYRAIPSIGNLFSDFAYEGRLKHHWKDSDQRLLNIPELPLKSVTYIPFKVESFDSMFGAKKLSRSPIHIYSALLATELSKFIAKKYAERNPNEEDLEVGIICPYASQAQLIEKMLEQVEKLPEGVKITTGTIHSFQGDQCNIVIALFNPPVGLRYGASNIHLNKLNIINVAISRAKDYLIVFLPDKQNCQGYEYLDKINRLVSISSQKYEKVTGVISASTVEKIIFGKTHYLESNTFVTSHQLANVYTKPTCLYEIRVDENSVDIQIGS